MSDTKTTNDSPSQPPPKRIGFWKRLVFSFVPLLVVVLIAEFATQLSRGEVFANYRLRRVELLKRGLPGEKNEALGYSPIPGFSGRDNQWETEVTIDADGFRTNGPGERPDGRLILTTGDSFTFGDEVSDHETWPANLEDRLEQPVLNGGVFGYSLGQAILRAEMMLDDHPDSEWLIVSLIEHDIARCEYSRHYADKPWFDLIDGKLVLQPNTAAENPPTEEELASKRWRDRLGHSALLDALFAHGTASMQKWWFLADKDLRAHPEGTGRVLAPLLADRIQEKCDATDTRLMFVLQGRHLGEDARTLLDHLAARGIPALDLVTPYLAAREQDPDLEDRYYNSHMTAEGNAWVAERVAAFLHAQD
ncbi:MAG: hypothetical protein AAF196_19100 [Planctomycetota bacterium]